MAYVDTNFLQTISQIFVETEWLSAEQINSLQPSEGHDMSAPAMTWKLHGRIFCVDYDGEVYFPRYQFDSACQPLGIIEKILTPLGPIANSWTLAAWFHFPNTWLVGENGMPLAPKDALNNPLIVKAAAKRKTSYVA